MTWEIFIKWLPSFIDGAWLTLIVDGAPVQLFQSRERARYYLCGDNTVAFEGSSGADSSDSELYSVSGGVLTAISGTPDSANYVRPEFTAFSNC